MVSPLENFSLETDSYGGEIHVSWIYPSMMPQRWKLYIFKKAAIEPPDEIMTAYFSGQITDPQLKEQGIFVFRDLPRDQSYRSFSDFMVENENTYHYTAFIQNTDDSDVSAKTSAFASPSALNIKIRVVDGKQIVARAIEKVIDSVRSADGSKPVLMKNISVFKSHARRKQEDFFIVVSRSAGQNIERYLNNELGQLGDAKIRGEVDMDTFQVEWICIGDPERRDKFTDIMRVMRSLMYRFIMRLGSGDVKDVKFVMNGDNEGQYSGENGVRGAMTVTLIVEQKLQIGNAQETATAGNLLSTFIGE